MRSTIGVCAGLFLVVSNLDAQAIDGRVIDAGTLAPVPRASVEALQGDSVVSRAITDLQGEFELRLPRAGSYALRATALGYESSSTASVQVGARELVEVTLRLRTEPIALDEITVEARRRDPLHAASYEGLYARREAFPRAGPRRVVLKDDPEMANAARVVDVLRWFLRTRGCIDFYMNGQPRDGTDWGILEMPTAWLEGVEYYRDGRDAPLEYMGGVCEFEARPYSVIAIWYERPPGED